MTGFNFCRIISLLTYTGYVALKGKRDGVTRAGVLPSPTLLHLSSATAQPSDHFEERGKCL